MTFSRKFAVPACVLAIACASGCTGTDVLSTGNSDFRFDVEVVNAENRFDLAQFSISAMNLRPNDAIADETLGPNPIAVFGGADDVLMVDLNDPGVIPTTIRLSTGTYRIVRIEMVNLLFRNLNAPRPAPDCSDLRIYQGPSVPFAITVSPALGNTNLVVGESGQGTLTITVDGAALVQAFEASFQSCALAQSVALDFNLGVFSAAAPTFLHLQ